MLRPLLPSQAQDTARPAPLASFEAAQQLMEADPAFDRLLPPDRLLAATIDILSCMLFANCANSRCQALQSTLAGRV